MKTQVTLETAIILTKYAITPISCWPLPKGASTFAVIRHHILLWVVVVHLVLVISSSLNTTYIYREDLVRVIKVLSESAAMISVVAKVLICRSSAPQLQVLIAQMEAFLTEATREEKKLIQTYVNKCVMPHTVVFVAVVVGPLTFIAAPIMISQPLPGDVSFPFSLERTWVFASMYLSQSICIMQVGCMVIVDIMFAILLWYTGARFHMLALEFRNAANAYDICQCIKKHQELLDYANLLKIPTRVIATEVTGTAMIGVTLGGFIIIRHPSDYEVAKYISFELVAAMELFLFTWPADSLMAASEEIADAVFDCNWIGKSPEMLKDMLFIMQRSRDPIIIEVAGLLPILSLEFYGSTMAATFSYLATLRAMIGE